MKDRVCVITGGAQGIGWALAEKLAGSGATVYGCDISEPHLAAARQRLTQLALKGKIILDRCDVTDGVALRGWIKDIVEDEGHIDILLNNAAYIRWGTVEQMTTEHSELTMRTGYGAMVQATHTVLPIMRAAGHGHIVNMGSSAGRVITGHASAAYAASKAAIEAYTETLRLELVDTPIGVTLVRPGVVAGTSFFRDNVPSSMLPRFADFMPILTPAQVAEAVVDAIGRRRPIVDIPRMPLRLMYLLYSLFPHTTRKIITIGGRARTDFGSV